MAKTLKQLQTENKKLQEKIQARSDLVKLERKSVELKQQNKKLLTQLKRSPTEKSIRRQLNVAGRGFFKGAKSIGSGLMRYGRFLNEEQSKIDRARRKVGKPKTRKISKKRKTSKRIKSSSKTRRRR